MRITIKSLLSGQHHPIHMGNCNVFVDGVKYNRVVELDTTEGWAEIVVSDSEGRMVHDGDSLKTRITHGEVVVMDDLQMLKERRQ